MSDDPDRIMNEAISVVEKLVTTRNLTTEEMCEIIEASMNTICEDLSRKLEEARHRIAELEDERVLALSNHSNACEAITDKDERIASLEAALKPLALKAKLVAEGKDLAIKVGGEFMVYVPLSHLQTASHVLKGTEDA